MYSKSETPLFISALKSSLHGRLPVEGNQFLRDLVVTEGEITAAFERVCTWVGGKHQGLPLCVAWSLVGGGRRG